VGCAVRLFQCSSPAIIRLCHYIVHFNYFNNHNHIRCSNLEGRGLQAPVKDRDTLIEQLVTRINEVRHRIIIKQVVYEEFMMQIKTVRHRLT